jgi:DNA polymerase-3 subunit epsilon
VSWIHEPFASFDIESTGVDIETARIVTASFAVIKPGVPPQTTSWLLNPGVDIPKAATEVHGITTEKAQAEGMDARAGVELIANMLLTDGFWAGVPVVIMNAPYDLSLLDRELRRHNLAPLNPSECRPVIDPMTLDRQLDKYRPGKRTLDALCKHFGVKLEGAHSSDGDALAAARVAWALAKRYPAQVGNVDLRDLHAQQSGWYAESSAGFADYLRGDADSIEKIKAQYWEDIPTAEEIRASLQSSERCNAKKAERLAKLMKEAGEADVVADLRARADEVDGQWPMRAWVGAAS